jgi:molecular chaperone DnaK
MVSDAETHAAEDKKQLELVNARNQCEAMVHSVRKSLKDYGDKLEPGEKDKIEAALKEAEAALKSEDKEAIDAKSQALAQVAQKLGEKMYADAQAAQAAAAPGAAPGTGEAQEGSAKKDDGNVVDAEFTEVKDGKK